MEWFLLHTYLFMLDNLNKTSLILSDVHLIVNFCIQNVAFIIELLKLILCVNCLIIFHLSLPLYMCLKLIHYLILLLFFFFCLQIWVLHFCQLLFILFQVLFEFSSILIALLTSFSFFEYILYDDLFFVITSFYCFYMLIHIVSSTDLYC